MACRTGCPTQDHASWAACARDSGIRVANCNSAAGWDTTRQKRWDAENEAYAAARAEGIQPAGTRMADIDKARAISDAQGSAFDAGTQRVI